MKIRLEKLEIEITEDVVDAVVKGVMDIEDNKTKNDTNYQSERLSKIFTFVSAMWPLYQEVFKFFSSGTSLDGVFPGFKKTGYRRPGAPLPYMKVDLATLQNLKSIVKDTGPIDVICAGWHLNLSVENDAYTLTAMWWSPTGECGPKDSEFLVEILSALGVPESLEEVCPPMRPTGPHKWIWNSAQPSGGFEPEPYIPEV